MPTQIFQRFNHILGRWLLTRQCNNASSYVIAALVLVLLCIAFLWISFFGIGDENYDPIPEEDWPMLKGVVNLKRPFAFRNQTAGGYSGFSLAVLELLSQQLQFKYTVDTAEYHTQVLGGTVTDVMNKKADFAIGDIDDRRAFHRYVAMTEPFFADDHLAAIVSRQTATNLSLCSIEDLVPPGRQQPPLIFWTRGYHYLRYIAQEAKQHRILHRIYHVLTNGTDLNLVTNSDEGLLYALEGNSAFLVELSTAYDLVREDNCPHLAILLDRILPRNIVMFLQKDSPWLGRFNAAIRRLQADGSIDRLREEFWGATPHCTREIAC